MSATLPALACTWATLVSLEDQRGHLCVLQTTLASVYKGKMWSLSGNTGEIMLKC